MNKQFNPPLFFFRLLRGCSVCMLIGFGSSAAIAAPNTDACALLKPTDLTPLFGGTPVANSNVSACRWSAQGSNKKLIVAKMNLHGHEEMAYSGARQNASKGGDKVTDEAGLGDKAFSVVGKSGFISLTIIKQGRMMQLQYATETTITPKDLDALRAVAKKAVAAY